MSRARVPRWFTEGLAEYETIIARPEWLRENDQDLFEAFRSERLPALGNMSRAFTRAEELEDVGMAYYASSQILVMLAGNYGHDKLAEMLRQWGKGKTSEQVMSGVLGKQPNELDAEFRASRYHNLARFSAVHAPCKQGPTARWPKPSNAAGPNDLLRFGSSCCHGDATGRKSAD